VSALERGEGTSSPAAPGNFHSALKTPSWHGRPALVFSWHGRLGHVFRIGFVRSALADAIPPFPFPAFGMKRTTLHWKMQKLGVSRPA
jgi:hypothetical protein